MARMLGSTHGQRQPSIHLLRVAWADLDAGGWNLRKALNPHWTFYWNDRPGATVVHAGATVRLEARRLVLIPGGCLYDTSCTAPVRHLFGYFALEGLNHRLLAALDHPLVIPALPGDGLLERLATDPRPGLDQRTSLALTALLAQAVTDILPADGLDLDPLEASLAPALLLLETEAHRPLANAELAAACGVSVNTLLRRFAAVVGTTPTQALRNRRVQMAANLLCTGDAPLDAIALRCGLGTRTYLARVFRAVLGMSPGEFRKRNR